LAVGMIAGSNAHASRARLLVHGTGDAGAILGTAGDNGSFFVDDAYNMFYNPSYLIDGKNWAIVEHLNGAATAMGGFTMDIASFKLAMFMNRQAAIATTGAGYGAGATPIRPIEVLFAGDTGVKWGVGASYAAMAGTSNTNSEL